jgi:hypothetical protein
MEEIYMVRGSALETKPIKRIHFYNSFRRYVANSQTIDDSNFVVVKPGQNYIVENFFSLIGLHSKRFKSGLKPGKYGIKYSFYSLPLIADQKDLQTKWIEHGKLWSEFINSEILYFEIARPKDSEKVNCQELPLNSNLFGRLD